DSLNRLIERHQPFIYNLAWKMIGNPDDAKDLTQEALISIVRRLDTFQFKSSFRTWAYRIVRNHFLNDQKKPARRFASSFEELEVALDSVPNIDLTETEQLEKQAEIREVRLTCLSGMILCLTKEQRMIFVIGELFKAGHEVGAEIMEISKANFRMKLSKARKDLVQFMEHKCGLVDKTNPCRCHKKVTVSLESGIIDAKDLLYNRKEYSTFREQQEKNAVSLMHDHEDRYLHFHQDHSFKHTFRRTQFMQELLEDPDWKRRLHLN
ncbi:MAG: RNA polymerase sigma factor, partial [Bacteroidota bacterium]